MGAAFTRFMVYTAAAAQGCSDTMRARSFLSANTSGMPLRAGWLPSPLPFFTPQWTPEAVKPMGAVTPPEICFISFTPC